MADPERVLVPTVGKASEDEALAYALETFPDAAVTLLAVVTPLDAPLSEGSVLARDETRTNEAAERAQDLVAAVGDDAEVDADPNRVTIETAEGRPADVVPQYVAETDVDHVVVLGTEASGSFVRRVLGDDVALTVADRAPVPVTVLE